MIGILYTESHGVLGIRIQQPPFGGFILDHIKYISEVFNCSPGPGAVHAAKPIVVFVFTHFFTSHLARAAQADAKEFALPFFLRLFPNMMPFGLDPLWMEGRIHQRSQLSEEFVGGQDIGIIGLVLSSAWPGELGDFGHPPTC